MCGSDFLVTFSNMPCPQTNFLDSWFCNFLMPKWGFTDGANGKEPTCQCRRHKETQVWSLGWEDPLEEGMATTPVILPGEFTDRGAWQATVHRVTKSWARPSSWVYRPYMHTGLSARHTLSPYVCSHCSSSVNAPPSLSSLNSLLILTLQGPVCMSPLFCLTSPDMLVGLPR